MGIEAKGKVEHRESFNDFSWEIEVHHIESDDLQSHTRISFKTAQDAFHDIVNSFSPEQFRSLLRNITNNKT